MRRFQGEQSPLEKAGSARARCVFFCVEVRGGCFRRENSGIILSQIMKKAHKFETSFCFKKGL